MYNDLSELMQRCDTFIRDARIKVGQFCSMVGIKRQSYYDWMNGKTTPCMEAVKKMEHFLSSEKARDLLAEGVNYLPLHECARITGLTRDVISRLCNDGVIKCIRSSGGRIRANIEQLRTYASMKNPGRIYFESEKNAQLLSFKDLRFDPDEVWKPMLSQNNDNEIFFPDRHEYANQYWISSKGHVYNATTRNVLGTEPDREGYIAVNLDKFDEDGNIVRITRPIHRLVAYFFAPHNDLFRDEVHHINSDPQDNRACNLLWCTPEEHYECRRLKKNKKAYRRYVNKIKRENRG